MATGNVAQPPEQWVADAAPAAAVSAASAAAVPAGVASRHHDSLLSMLFRGSRPGGHLLPGFASPYAAFSPHLMYSYAAEAFGVGMPTVNSHALPLTGSGGGGSMIGGGSAGAQKIEVGGNPHLLPKGASQFLPPVAQAPPTPPPLAAAATPSLLHQQQQHQAFSCHKDPSATVAGGAAPPRSPHLVGESAANARTLPPKTPMAGGHAKRHSSSSSTDDALNFSGSKEASAAKRPRPSTAAAVDRARRGSSASPSLSSSPSSAMAPPRPPPPGSPSVHHGPQPATSAAPPPPSGGQPHRAAYFRKGSVVQLTEERLKRVEDLTTEDFAACASASQHLRLDSSTVAKIVEDRAKGTALLTFHVGESRVQVEVEALLEHPFFLYHRGWASACPSRTMEVYHLACRQLAVGDCFISLTRREPPQSSLLATQPMRVQQPLTAAKPALGPTTAAHGLSQSARRQSLSASGGQLLRQDADRGSGSPTSGRAAAATAAVIREPRPE